MWSKFRCNLLHLDQDRSRRRPAEQYRPPGRKARKFPQERTETIRDKAFHQLLVAVIDKPV